jgi:hypothetical protein
MQKHPHLFHVHNQHERDEEKLPARNNTDKTGENIFNGILSIFFFFFQDG